MTEQYTPGGINPLTNQPVALQTLDAVAVLVTLGALTQDGTSLLVEVVGGGSGSVAPGTNNYVVIARAIFTRVAGTIAVGSLGVTVNNTGLFAIIGFAVDVPNALAQLSITGPALVYNHRFKVITYLF